MVLVDQDQTSAQSKQVEVKFIFSKKFTFVGNLSILDYLTLVYPWTHQIED